MLGLEPWSYLRDLLCLLPEWPVHRVLELAPAYWLQTALATTSRRSSRPTHFDASPSTAAERQRRDDGEAGSSTTRFAQRIRPLSAALPKKHLAHAKAMVPDAMMRNVNACEGMRCSSRWTRLMRFLDDPEIPLDNNRTEAGFIGWRKAAESTSGRGPSAE